MRLLNHVLEVRLSSRHRWSHFRVHRHAMHRHIVWGRLSITVGQPHLEEIGLCAVCGSTDVGERSCGDEGWTVCGDCGSVEQGYEYVTIEEAERRGVL